MRLNSYISGLGEGDGTDSIIPDFTAYDTSSPVSTDANISSPTINLPTFDWGSSIAYGTPTTANPVASSSWSNLLQSVIKTGVGVGSQIALTQNAVPQLAPGTTYSYNARTGSYIMTAAQPGTASVISTSAGSFLTSPIVLLGLAGLGIFLIVRKR